MKSLLDICEEILQGKCVRYRDMLICRNNTFKVSDLGQFSRVSVNLCYVNLPKTVSASICKLPRLEMLPSMEVTMLKDEYESIGVWLAFAALGLESHKPTDLLCWPSGDYAWTLRAAEIEKPDNFWR